MPERAGPRTPSAARDQWKQGAVRASLISLALSLTLLAAVFAVRADAHPLGG